MTEAFHVGEERRVSDTGYEEHSQMHKPSAGVEWNVGRVTRGEVCQRKEQDEEIRKQSRGERPAAGALQASDIP